MEVKNSLIVLPEARQKGIDLKKDPFLSLINSAKKNLLMASYKLKSNQLPQKDMLAALKAATGRGVNVHLITEGRLTDMEKSGTGDKSKQGDPQKAYGDIGVHVHSIWNTEKYNQSHTKFMVVDAAMAMLGTTNFDKEPEGRESTKRPFRDFAVRTNDPKIIAELTQMFWNDVEKPKKSFKTTGRQILWGPEGQRERFNELIATAKESIRIYQQDLTDKGILSGLIAAAKRKVNVEVVMSPHPFGFDKPDNNTPNQKVLTKAGGRVFLNNKVGVHAKMMMIDDRKMYLGSTNFYQPAIDKNRNVGLLTEDKTLIQQLGAIFEQDKKDTSPLKL